MMYTMNVFKPHMDMSDVFAPFFQVMDPLTAAASFRVDIHEKDDKYELIADLPGVQEDKITVTVDHDDLVIAADRENEFKDDKNLRSERRFGHMERRFQMDGIDRENIQAAYKNGVLYVNLPKEKPEENAGVRKIEIQKA